MALPGEEGFFFAFSFDIPTHSDKILHDLFGLPFRKHYPNSQPLEKDAAMTEKNLFLEKLKNVSPSPIRSGMSVSELVDACFFGHNSRSIRDACHLFSEKIARENTCIAVSLAGALVPVGLGESAIIPLIEANLIDWLISTGAYLYHDIHSLLGYTMKMSPAAIDDCVLREKGVIRIHNVVFDQQALYDTDAFVRETMATFISREHPRAISSATLNRALGLKLLSISPDAARHSILAAAAAKDIPVFTPAVNDSSIGMNLAALALRGLAVHVDTLKDVNESAAIVYNAKKNKNQSAVLILGGGSPKNFLLQTEPHIQEVLGLPEQGHDYFIQMTDARVDTGGLSGATPSEAVTWGKIDPEGLSSTVVCYGDVTVYLPLLTAYVLDHARVRRPSRLAKTLDRLVAQLKNDYEQKR
jgi:deoxyhypusine synthase